MCILKNIKMISKINLKNGRDYYENFIHDLNGCSFWHDG